MSIKAAYKTYLHIVLIMSVALCIGIALASLKTVQTMDVQGTNARPLTAYQRYVLYVERHISYKLPYYMEIEKTRETDLIYLYYKNCIRELLINGNYVRPLPTCESGGRKVIYIGSHLDRGKNTISINAEVTENGSFTVKIVSYKFLNLMALLIFTVILTGYFLHAVFRFYTWRAILSGFSIAALCFIWFMLNTHFYEYSHDPDSHMEYINRLIRDHKIPYPSEGFVLYHPPLYYMIAAAIKSVADQIKDTNFYALRTFSILCYLGFLYYGMRIIEIILPRSRFFFLALALFFLWPSGIMMAPRIDNSALYYLIATASFYNLLQWYNETFPSRKHLIISLLLAGIAMLVRTSALVLFPVIILTCIYKKFHSKLPWKYFIKRSLFYSLLFFLLTASYNFGRNLEERIERRIDNPFVVGNTSYLQYWDIYVGNKLGDFLTFDYHSYFDEIFFDDKKTEQRKNFWVVLIKSSITGEKHFVNTFAVWWLNILILLMVCLVLFPIFFYRKKDFSHLFPLLIFVAGNVAASAWNRWNSPVWTSGDFRYIVPILPAFVGIYIYNMQIISWLNKPFVRLPLVLMTIIFIILGLIIYLGEFI